jgi:hypothetical protein
MSEFEMETMVIETESMMPIAEAGASELVLLEEGELDGYSGGMRDAGASSSFFNRDRLATTRGSFSGPEGSGSFETKMAESITTGNSNSWDFAQ